MTFRPIVKRSLGLLLMSFAFGAQACPPGPAGGRAPAGMPMHGMPPMPPMLAMPFMMPPPPILGLDDAQDKKIFALMQAQAQTRHEAQRAAAKTLDELNALTRSQNFDAQKVKALADAHGRQIAEMIFLNAQSMAQMRAVLTDEQRKQLDELGPLMPPGKGCRNPAN